MKPFIKRHVQKEIFNKLESDGVEIINKPKDDLDDELNVKIQKAVDFAIDLKFPQLKK